MILKHYNICINLVAVWWSDNLERTFLFYPVRVGKIHEDLQLAHSETTRQNQWSENNLHSLSVQYFTLLVVKLEVKQKQKKYCLSKNRIVHLKGDMILVCWVFFLKAKGTLPLLHQAKILYVTYSIGDTRYTRPRPLKCISLRYPLKFNLFIQVRKKYSANSETFSRKKIMKFQV